MVTIDNSALLGLSGNSTLTKEFPFLLQAKVISSGSRACCGGGSAQSTTSYNQLKMQIAHMPGESKVKFKQITGWDKVRVTYETSSGTHTEIF